MARRQVGGEEGELDCNLDRVGKLPVVEDRRLEAEDRRLEVEVELGIGRLVVGRLVEQLEVETEVEVGG